MLSAEGKSTNEFLLLLIGTLLKYHEDANEETRGVWRAILHEPDETFEKPDFPDYFLEYDVGYFRELIEDHDPSILERLGSDVEAVADEAGQEWEAFCAVAMIPWFLRWLYWYVSNEMEAS